MENRPMVSIWCLTYNHEKYIRDALEGFLNQKVDFTYEIVIHDDASTDETPMILKEYEKKYPKRIKVIYEKENTYRTKNFSKLMREIKRRELKGKYIAMCEGDDFWIDINKLQIQVDYLETHPECVYTAHDAIRLECDSQRIEVMRPYTEDKDISAEELIIQYNGNLPTNSVVVRREVLDLDGFFLEAGVGDYPMQLYALTKGKVHYFTRIMAVYRYLHEGSWSKETMQKLDNRVIHLFRMTNFLQKYNEYTKKRYEKFVIAKIQIYIAQIVYGYQELKINEFVKKCALLDEKSNYIYRNYFGEIQRIFRQTFDDKYCDEELKELAQKYTHKIILGTGKYGSLVARQLENAGILFDGFAVSDNQKVKREYCKKKVWKLSDLPFQKENMLVIIAINPVIWNELSDAIECAGIEHYMCPFLLKDIM